MSFIDTFNDILLYILYFVLGFIALFVLIFLINVIILLFKGYKLPKRTVKSKYKKRNIFLKLFYDAPKAKARDFFDRNPDSMNIHGLFMFCGRQGSGKTIAALYVIRALLQKFPLIKIRTNISVDFQHGKIEHWQDIINVHNGEIGQIDFLDEAQNWFSSNESKNFPPDMLQEVTQERKKHKVIMGTSQVFTRLAKPLREQTTYLCEPHTLFGCFTVCLVFKPELKDDGTLLKKRFLRMFCFVHDDDLRNCYNTYERVERLAIKGYQSMNERGF